MWRELIELGTLCSYLAMAGLSCVTGGGSI